MTEKPQNRNTKQRNLVIECFKENIGRHLTVDEIFEYIKKNDIKIGIATVYRNVKLLHEQDVIKKVELPNCPTCYELCCHNDIHSHHHLICQKCGLISDFDDDLLEKVERQIEETNGFKINDHRVLFYGICKNCRI